MSKFKSFIVDIIFWGGFVIALYIVKEYWNAPERWIIVWLSGYILMFAGSITKEVVGVSKELYDDYTEGMMLIFGWIFGVLMYLVGFGWYLDSKVEVGGWMSENVVNIVVGIVLSIFGFAWAYGIMKWLGRSGVVATGIGLASAIFFMWLWIMSGRGVNDERRI